MPIDPDRLCSAPDDASATSASESPRTNAMISQAHATATHADGLPRREFLRVTGLGAGALLAGCRTAGVPAAPGIDMNGRRDRDVAHVVVVGAGIWGSWTAYHLRRRGARVTLVDAYGPGNSRSTSGDETRGIRSSYGDRTTVVQWTKWARAAMQRWQAFDDEWAKHFGTKFYHVTGDVIMRAADEPFLKNTRETWAAQGVKHEVLTGDDARRRWPLIKADDITIALYEPDAGVVRARHVTQAVTAVAQQNGVRLVIGRVKPGPLVNGQMDGVVLEDGTPIRGDAYVFACGPWLQKLFPDLLAKRMRVPLGYVCYFGTPVGDTRFTYPNMPSYNFPGVTGWPTLPVDNRGFRVRGALAAPAAPAAAGTSTSPNAGTNAGSTQGTTTPRPATPVDPLQADPDTSTRWASQERIDGSRRFLEARFPTLARAPLIETRACHYESSINRDFIVDRIPGASNAWIAGIGQAEGFKFAPVTGDYVAQRVLGDDGDPALVKAFRMPTEEYEA